MPWLVQCHISSAATPYAKPCKVSVVKKLSDDIFYGLWCHPMTTSKCCSRGSSSSASCSPRRIHPAADLQTLSDIKSLLGMTNYCSRDWLDASSVGLGAILCQKDEKGVKYINAYASRSEWRREEILTDRKGSPGHRMKLRALPPGHLWPSLTQSLLARLKAHPQPWHSTRSRQRHWKTILQEDKVMQLAHEGHQGIVKTKLLLTTKVWFPDSDRRAEAAVHNCPACQT